MKVRSGVKAGGQNQYKYQTRTQTQDQFKGDEA
jgi:hypothetical protein